MLQGRPPSLSTTAPGLLYQGNDNDNDDTDNDYSIKACTANPAHWPPLEACLHAWYAVAESLADSEEEDANPLLPLFLAKLPVKLSLLLKVHLIMKINL